jgi:non-ribosomal peptide synthetase component E (peptide arylation enzyme)
VQDPRALLAELAGREHQRVALNCVPSLWQAVLDALDAGAPPPVTLVALLLGGDQLTQRLVDRTWAHLPGLSIWNIYGPTEATANAAAGPVTASDDITIGTPVDNTEVFVLDDRGQLVPPGLPGELYIGGANLARGYLNRPGETASRFVAHPFREGARLYRSGDIARLLPDGRIRLLGRNDRQVKVRSFRVELGEIEAALTNHPQVTSAVALAQHGPDGNRLVAYVVIRPSGAVSALDIRRFLSTQLSDYMVPQSIVCVDSFPMLPAGKIDLAALPPPGASSAEGAAPLPPRTELERHLAGVWREVLGVAEIGVYDNFFDVGGHSLLVLQIQARLQVTLGRDVPVVDFFRYPDIASLAAHLGGLEIEGVDERRIDRMVEGRHSLTRLRERGRAS